MLESIYPLSKGLDISWTIQIFMWFLVVDPPWNFSICPPSFTEKSRSSCSGIQRSLFLNLHTLFQQKQMQRWALLTFGCGTFYLNEWHCSWCVFVSRGMIIERGTWKSFWLSFWPWSWRMRVRSLFGEWKLLWFKGFGQQSWKRIWSFE